MDFKITTLADGNDENIRAGNQNSSRMKKTSKINILVLKESGKKIEKKIKYLILVLFLSNTKLFVF